MNTNAKDPSRPRETGIFDWAVFSGMAALVIYLIFRGYPLPFYDDLAVVGAALNLAKGGEFQNPYVADWMAAFPAAKPFFYPPGMSYLLGGWLRVFGIGSPAMVAFQWCALIGGGVALGSLLRRWFFQPRLVALVAGFAFVLAFQMEGMRNEVAAYAFAFAGLCLCFRDAAVARMGGYFLIAFSGVIYPIVPLMAVPLYAGLFLIHRRTSDDRAGDILRKLGIECLLALPGLLASAGLFLWMINWETSEFLRVIRVHKQLAIPGGPLVQIQAFIAMLTAYSQIFVRLPITLLSLLAVLASFVMSWKSKSKDWIAPTALLVCWVACVLGNPMRARFFAPILQVAIIMIALAGVWRGKVWISAGVGMVLIGLVNSKTLLSALLQSPMNPERIAAARETVRSIDHSRTRVFICAWTARHVYDYNIPPQVVDINTWTGVPRLRGGSPRFLDFANKPANEVWIERTEDFHMNSEKSGDGLFAKPESAKLFGKSLGNIAASQGELQVR